MSLPTNESKNANGDRTSIKEEMQKANPPQSIVRPNTKGADAYRDPSWWYDLRGFFLLMGTYQVSLWSHLRFFSKNLGQRHLEAAVGSGTFLSLTLFTHLLLGRKLPKEIVGIDYAEIMLNGAKRLFRFSKRVNLIQADLSTINYENEYFDSINIAHSFHAFPDANKVLKELHRVLKGNGQLYVDILLSPKGGKIRKAIGTSVNNFCYRKGILSRTFEVEEIESIFESNHFEIVEKFQKGNTFHIIARKEKASLNQ